MVFFSRPGDVRRFRVRGLDGACFFFTAAFVREAFADPRFLHRFRFFGPDRAQAAFRLTLAERRLFLDLFSRMEAEIRSLTRDASEALRALLYEMLVRLDRFSARRVTALPAARRRSGRGGALPRPRGARLRAGPPPGDYASELRVTPGHLSALCRAALGKSAGACVRDRRALEARRLSRYSGQGAAEVGYALGFDDPAYFARFVKRETGRSPTDLALRPAAYGVASRSSSAEKPSRVRATISICCGPRPTAAAPGPRGWRATSSPRSPCRSPGHRPGG